MSIRAPTAGHQGLVNDVEAANPSHPPVSVSSTLPPTPQAKPLSIESSSASVDQVPIQVPDKEDSTYESAPKGKLAEHVSDLRVALSQPMEEFLFMDPLVRLLLQPLALDSSTQRRACARPPRRAAR